MIICKECGFYSEDDLTELSPQDKLDHVSGHCMDSGNPDFNEWARMFGRGIVREDSYTSPKWCAKRENPEKTEEYYSEEEISEAVAKAKQYQKTSETIKKLRNMSEEELFKWMGVK